MVDRVNTSTMKPISVAMAAGLALMLAMTGQNGWAQEAPPTEHKGLEVAALGIISEESMQTQIGLTGYKLQMRAITIKPGGQIAKHSHEKRPGLVKVIDGQWTEGRPDKEGTYTQAEPIAILEDNKTVHWFWNRGKENGTAIVCDIVPAK